MIQPVQPSPEPKKNGKTSSPPPPKEGASEFDHVIEKIALDAAKEFWKAEEKK